MSTWRAYETFAERNADASAKVEGMCIYVNQTNDAPPKAVRQYWSASGWKPLCDPVASAPLPPGDSQPQPEPEPNPSARDWFINPGNYLSAHHRGVGRGARYFIPAGCTNPNDANPTYKNAGPELTPDSPNPFANIGAFNCAGGKQGVKYYNWIEPAYSNTKINPNEGADKGLPYTEKFPADGPWPPDDGDSNFMCFPENGDTEAQKLSLYYNFYWGQKTAKSRKSYRIDGLDYPPGPSGSSASGVPWPMTILQGREVNGTDPFIGHCLNVTATRHKRQGAKTSAIILSKLMVFPAYRRDGSADNPDENTGTVPYGCRAVIPEWFWNLRDTLGLDKLGLAFFDCLRNYGVYFLDGQGQHTDNANKGVLQLRRDQDIPPGSKLESDITARLNIILPYLRPLGNVRPHNQETELDEKGIPWAGGGGSNGQVNTAWDCPR